MTNIYLLQILVQDFDTNTDGSFFLFGFPTTYLESKTRTASLGRLTRSTTTSESVDDSNNGRALLYRRACMVIISMHAFATPSSSRLYRGLVLLAGDFDFPRSPSRFIACLTNRSRSLICPICVKAYLIKCEMLGFGRLRAREKLKVLYVFVPIFNYL